LLKKHLRGLIMFLKLKLPTKSVYIFTKTKKFEKDKYKIRTELCALHFQGKVTRFITNFTSLSEARGDNQIHYRINPELQGR
jgi:hypothetical protein